MDSCLTRLAQDLVMELSTFIKHVGIVVILSKADLCACDNTYLARITI
jgi:hypothetical protein